MSLMFLLKSRHVIFPQAPRPPCRANDYEIEIKTINIFCLWLLSPSAQSAYKSGPDEGPCSGLFFKAGIIANWVSRCEMGSSRWNFKCERDKKHFYPLDFFYFFPLRDVIAGSGDTPAGVNSRTRQKNRDFSFQNWNLSGCLCNREPKVMKSTATFKCICLAVYSWRLGVIIKSWSAKCSCAKWFWDINSVTFTELLRRHCTVERVYRDLILYVANI